MNNLGIQTVKITKVYSSDRTKDGREYLDKRGQKYWKVSIKTDKHGDDWYSTLAFKSDDKALSLKEGSIESLIFEQNGSFKNFKVPKKEDLLEADIQSLKERVKLLEENQRRQAEGKPMYPPFQEPDFSAVQDKQEKIDPDDIPF